MKSSKQIKDFVRVRKGKCFLNLSRWLLRIIKISKNYKIIKLYELHYLENAMK